MSFRLIDELQTKAIPVMQSCRVLGVTVIRPLLTTLDILDVLQRRGVLSPQRKQEARTMLRRANFALMPLDDVELLELVTAAPVTSGVLTETAELRAVRENILRVRMSELVQLPKELAWLNGMIRACLLALKSQWKASVNEPEAVARSDWLLALGDVRGWTHCLNEDARQLMERYRNWVALLMVLPAIQPELVKAAYWRWFESRILRPIAEEDPETYEFLIERAKALVIQGIEYSGKNLGATDE